MKKNLYIFTVGRSNKPDLYINIIGCCVLRYGIDSLNEIELIKIGKADDDKKKQTADLIKIRENIKKQISALSNMKYHEWDFKNNSLNANDIDLEQPIKLIEIIETYNSINDKITTDEIRVKVIQNNELKDVLIPIASNKYYEFIFDITGVPKEDFLNISLILLSIDSDLYYLKVNKNFTHNANDLLHNLSIEENEIEYFKLNNKEYEVIDISNRKKSKAELIVSWRHDIAHNNISSALKSLEKYIQDNIETIDSKLVNSITISASRYRKKKEELNNGIIDNQHFDLETNRIQMAILEIIRSL